MKTRTFGIIGCQHAHIQIFMKEMQELGHVCAGIYEQENIELASRLAEEAGVPLLSDPAVLLADPEVGIIGCASINEEKIDVIEQCERSGQHVMVDKPAVTTAEGLERLRGVIRRGRIQVGMLLTERFRPSVYTLKKRIEAGELGELISITMRKPHRLNPSTRPSWHFSKRQNGGIVIDLLIHDMDLLRWLTGREIGALEGFMAKSSYPEYPDFYDSTGVQVYMDNHVTGYLYADWYTPEKSWTWGDCRIFVTGTSGNAELRLEGDPLISQEDLLLTVTNLQTLQRITLEVPPVSITEDFLGRIEGRPAVLGHEDILKASQAVWDADQHVRRINRIEASSDSVQC